MFTDSEVTPLKARQSHSRVAIAAAAGLLVLAAALPAASQPRTRAGLMIPTLQSSDKDLGVQSADAI
jgi:predicted lysophospholipase L1 biosynthesis ABC-type transport system permease subunit